MNVCSGLTLKNFVQPNLAYSCYCVAWPPGNSVGMRCFLLHNLLFMANLRRRLWRIPEDTYYIHRVCKSYTFVFWSTNLNFCYSSGWQNASIFYSFIHFFFTHTYLGFFCIATGEKCLNFSEVFFFIIWVCNSRRLFVCKVMKES